MTGKFGFGKAEGIGWFPRRVENQGAGKRVLRKKGESDFQRVFSGVRRSLLKARKSLGASGNFLDFPLAVLDDPELEIEVRKFVKSGKSLQDAVLSALAVWEKRLEEIEDPYLRLRAADLSDLRSRLLAFLGENSRWDFPDEAFIALAKDLSVFDLLDWRRAPLQAICLEEGNEASHGVLLARALGIPVVGGLKGLLRRCKPGEWIRVENRQVICLPEGGTRSSLEFPSVIVARRRTPFGPQDIAGLRTKDAIPITLRANVHLADEVEKAKGAGAQGIGLFRTEFLHMTGHLSMKQEAAIYHAAAQLFKPYPVVFRLADFGSDKPFSGAKWPEEKNPALGWRGMRFLLDNPRILKRQLEALCRGAGKETLHLLLPMVRDLEEVRKFFETFNPIQKKYRVKSRVGIMIETPSAAFLLHKLPRAVSFVSLGTNDLLQYFFAVDRLHPEMKADPLHPAFLSFLDEIIGKAGKAGKSISICGEMASDPRALRTLVSMGFREFSVSISKLREAARAIRQSVCK